MESSMSESREAVFEDHVIESGEGATESVGDAFATPEIVSETAKREGLGADVVETKLSGIALDVYENVVAIQSKPKTYYGHMAVGKPIPMNMMRGTPVSKIKSSPKDEEDSRFGYDPDKITYYTSIEAVYPFGTSNIFAFRNCIVDAKRRFSKGNQQVAGYMVSYMYVGIPESALKFMSDAISDLVTGSVGSSRSINRSGYYWTTLNISSPDKFKYRATTRVEGSDPAQYEMAMESLGSEDLLSSDDNSPVATLFLSVGASFTTTNDAHPNVEDIGAEDMWLLSMKVVGCHIVLNETAKVGVASNITRTTLV